MQRYSAKLSPCTINQFLDATLRWCKSFTKFRSKCRLACFKLTCLPVFTKEKHALFQGIHFYSRGIRLTQLPRRGDAEQRQMQVTGRVQYTAGGLHRCRLKCVYKFLTHYLNNIIFYRQQFGASSERIILYKTTVWGL
jgi:hypothetical protein